jgi:hypothetical protein
MIAHAKETCMFYCLRHQGAYERRFRFALMVQIPAHALCLCFPMELTSAMAKVLKLSTIVDIFMIEHVWRIVNDGSE